VARDFGTLRKPYRAPAFERIDINTARAALQAEGAAKDGDAQQMSALIDEHLAAKRSVEDRVRRNPAGPGVVR
jgi:hypothetical protein